MYYPKSILKPSECYPDNLTRWEVTLNAEQIILFQMLVQSWNHNNSNNSLIVLNLVESNIMGHLVTKWTYFYFLWTTHLPMWTYLMFFTWKRMANFRQPIHLQFSALDGTLPRVIYDTHTSPVVNIDWWGKSHDPMGKCWGEERS